MRSRGGRPKRGASPLARSGLFIIKMRIQQLFDRSKRAIAAIVRHELDPADQAHARAACAARARILTTNRFPKIDGAHYFTCGTVVLSLSTGFSESTYKVAC